MVVVAGALLHHCAHMWLATPHGACRAACLVSLLHDQTRLLQYVTIIQRAHWRPGRYKGKRLLVEHLNVQWSACETKEDAAAQLRLSKSTQVVYCLHCQSILPHTPARHPDGSSHYCLTPRQPLPMLQRGLFAATCSCGCLADGAGRLLCQPGVQACPAGNENIHQHV
jgi:hypothetical protein